LIITFGKFKQLKVNKMHEISLVRNIFRTLEGEFSEGELSRIKTINLRVGKLSNVEPILMQNAFEAVTATDSPQFKAVKLNIETVPIKIYCADCDTESEIENYRFRCKICDKPNNNVVQGTELLISGVEFLNET
jgi:hydrogenase nickel incorporation protein HypA/HybF